MKKLIVIATLILLLFATVALADDFCDGWTDGYIAGWCQGQYSGCFEPFVPPCPFSNIGEDSYRDGYSQGFLAGMRDRG